MKSKYYLIIMVSILFSCDSGKQSNNEKTSVVETQDTTEQAVKKVLARDPRKIGPEKLKTQYIIEDNIYKINASENPIYGYWVGTFGKNKINIALAHISEDSIFGHSVCAGNFRAIKGTIEAAEPGKYKVMMQEPGDDKYDGEFNFVIDADSKELSGTWKPYKNTTSAKEYTLAKRIYNYDPDIGDYPDASTRYLEVSDVVNMLPEEIEMVRNEIYARHGYSFTNMKMRRIFDNKDWYIPMGVDIREQLTDIEAVNIDLLYNYEDYYEEYYDDFGR